MTHQLGPPLSGNVGGERGGQGGDGASSLVHGELGLHAGFPVPLAIVDEPVGELLEFDACFGHDLGLLLFGGVGVGYVLGGHHPCLEVVDGFLGEGSGLFGRGGGFGGTSGWEEFSRCHGDCVDVAMKDDPCGRCR